LPGYHSSSSRERVAELMHRAPVNLHLLPIAAIESTLTFNRLGAAGERAAIDDNVDTSAADPGGFHPGSVITIRLRSVADVYGVRILSARAYGIEKPGTLRAVCDQDGGGEIGQLALEAGTLTMSEALWDKPCRTSVLRMVPAGIAAKTNFWISEIQVIGRPVDQQGRSERD
jgi:hypothetical protein